MGSLSTWSFDKLDLYLVIFTFVVAAILFRFKPTFPSIGTIQIAIELLNTKGGIIAVLGGMSLLFFFVGVRFIYWSANMILDGKITPDNAIVISGFNWITGIAFGGVFGAMIKTMTGESPPSSQTEVSTSHSQFVLPDSSGTTSTETSKTTVDNGIIQQEPKQENSKEIS